MGGHERRESRKRVTTVSEKSEIEKRCFSIGFIVVLEASRVSGASRGGS